MKNQYKDLIEQTFDFPQEDFSLKNNCLVFNGINLMDLIEEHGTPLRVTYLPKIGSQIQRARNWFQNAIKTSGFKGNYTYCYCTKSSHFSFIVEEALKHGSHIETSSAFDISIIEELAKQGKISKDTIIICNGFKRPYYIQKIANLFNSGFKNVIPILDNLKEIDEYEDKIDSTIQVGIRIATEEEPNFNFYTSRLGIPYKDILNHYHDKIKSNPKFDLKILHFFMNTGIRDQSFYWNELRKGLNIYGQLKKVCETLDSLDIGGGFPIKNSLGFEYDYQYMANEIVGQITTICKEHEVDEPNIISEFGTFTVGESGAMIYTVLDQKRQNDNENWYMIDSSIMTTLPDTWGIEQRFILLPINKWDAPYSKVNIGGLTCDSLDFYNSEAHDNQIFMPEISENDSSLIIGFFNTGAYQESIGGFGGIQHCLIPSPKHIIVSKDENGTIQSSQFRGEQTEEEVLTILGY